MAELPAGTVTFLFTDIEGSTRLWEHDPRGMQSALARHDTILSAAIERHSGRVFKTIGDAFCAVFDSAGDAAVAAIEAQRALQREVQQFRVRMAIHSGAAEVRGGDYFGPALNRVARLLAAGHGGQVLLSGVTAELIRPSLSEGTSLRPLGVHRLRDLATSEAVFQLRSPGLPSDFPPLNTLDVAFRRGVLRATGVSALILAVVASLALAAVRSESRARRLAAERQTTLVETRRQLYVAKMGLVQQAWDAGNVDRALELLNDQRPKPEQEDLRGFEWRYFWRLCQGEQFLTLRTKGHTGCVAFSPDGKTLAFVSGTAVRLWDVASHRDLAAFQGHTRWVSGVAFSPDQRLLATSGEDASVRLWDVASRRQVFRFKGPAEANCVAFSPNGKTLAAGWGDNRARLWDVASRRELRTPKGHPGPVLALAFSPDGKTLAMGGGDGTVRLWDVRTSRPPVVLRVRQGRVWCVAFSPDGRTLAAGSWGQDVRLWDVASREVLKDLRGHTAEVRAVVFSPDGKWLATGSQDKTVKLWEVATKQQVHTFKGHHGHAWYVAFSPDGRTLATTGRSDGTVRLWPAVPPWDSDVLRGSGGSVAFSSDGKTLAAGSWSGAVILWDVPSRRKLGRIPVSFGEAHGAPTFSPDGKLLATESGVFGKTRDVVELWETGTRRRRATLKGHTGGANSAVFSPNGTLLAAGSDGDGVRLWDVATMQELPSLKGHPVAVSPVAFSPDGKTLATGSHDGAVNLWDVAGYPPEGGGRQIATLTGKPASIWCLRFSPDGKTLAAGGATPLEESGIIRLWDVAARRELPALVGHNALVMSVDFSPDAKTLASASVDHTVKLWNLLTEQEVTTFRELEGASVAFSPDGTLLAAGRGKGGYGVGDAGIKLFRAATVQETEVPSNALRHQSSR